MKIKIFLIWLAFLLIVILTVLIISKFFGIIYVKDKIFFVQKAFSDEQKEIGLSERNGLCKNCARLFVFEKNGKYAFCMKNMRFDLDIIWIQEKKIVYIEKNISYLNERIFYPETKADKVLEINAGLSDRYGFKEGDEVKIY